MDSIQTFPFSLVADLANTCSVVVYFGVVMTVCSFALFVWEVGGWDESTCPFTQPAPVSPTSWVYTLTVTP